MNIDFHGTDTAILTLLGERITRKRLSRNLTQAQLAEEAGVGVRTIQRLERGEAGMQLSGFVRVCKALGIAERLDLLIPEEPESPMALLKRKDRKRKRATGKPSGKSSAKKWSWGDAK